ncbi:MAG: hypothetical protein LBO62_08130 [Endomicrobium sp.]|jgi:hypothetical protein|nr:hypothetical protein [Endomicrobium sp.]
MRKKLFCFAFAAVFLFPFTHLQAAHEIKRIDEGENKKIKINENYSFKYVFPRKPKLGISVVKISVFDKDGKQSNALVINGAYDMPQMRGHHSSGPVKFQINKDSFYLMPLNSVMRGKWEIFLQFKEDDRVLYEGAIYIEI